VHPAIFETYLDGNLIEGLKQQTEKTLENSLGKLRSEEAAVLTFLREKLAHER
jgi:DNA topoisomerase-1